MRKLSGSPFASTCVLVLGVLLLLQLIAQQLLIMFSNMRPNLLFTSLVSVPFHASVATAVDLTWHAPAETNINNLTNVLSSSGIYGFIYDTSETPDDKYGTYNWCNMPHVRSKEYVKPSSEFELVYVELMHRHHKRTPYASNAFPVESYHWNCDDQGLYYFGRHFNGKKSAEGYWKEYISPINPFKPSGWIGTCQFPQITAAGLDDSWQHGKDLYDVYHNLLGFLPAKHDKSWRDKVTYRVTTNQITSQVAGMVIDGMWGATDSVPLAVQASAVDSLEPTYTCTAASDGFNTIKSGKNQAWQAHLTAAQPLYAVLDDISGVPPNDTGFHASLDHYYDNLSARQCHQKPLPCKLVDGKNDTSHCVTQAQADAAYRLGHWEYSQIYRDVGPAALAASAASLGVWVAELAAHLRDAVAGKSAVLYYHNVAHDGSVSRLLGILQIDVMVWPGMGSEVVFEVWRKTGAHYVRVLFGGKVLKSSNPSLGVMDMVPVETLLAYFDGLVGVGASLVLGKCNGAIAL